MGSNWVYKAGLIEPHASIIARVDAFAEQLKARPERVIAAFGHSDFFNELAERHLGLSELWLENCQVFRVELRRG